MHNHSWKFDLARQRQTLMDIKSDIITAHGTISNCSQKYSLCGTMEGSFSMIVIHETSIIFIYLLKQNARALQWLRTILILLLLYYLAKVKFWEFAWIFFLQNYKIQLGVRSSHVSPRICLKRFFYATPFVFQVYELKNRLKYVPKANDLNRLKHDDAPKYCISKSELT